MTTLDNRSVSLANPPYAPRVLLVWSGKHALRISLLVIIASGMCLSNIRILGLTDSLGVSDVLALLFIAFTALRYLHRTTPMRPLLVVIPIIIILYNVGIHGILFGYLRDSQFLGSVVRLSIYMVLIIAGSVVWLHRQQLRALNRIICFWTYLMGSVGIVQFAVTNIYSTPWYILPESMRRSGNKYMEAEITSGRFGGLIRASGFASEPSFYGIGMSVLLSLCLTCILLVPQTGWRRWYQWGALVVSVLGVIVSVSGAAWVLTGAVLIAWLLSNIQWRGTIFLIRSTLSRYQRRVTCFGMVFLLLTCIVAVIFLFPYIEKRITQVRSGEEASASSRVDLSIILLIQPSDNLVQALLGTGVGRQATSKRLWHAYDEIGLSQYMKETGQGGNIWNTYAYVAVTGGYIGLGLILWLVFVIVRARNHTGLPLHFFAVLLIIYPMAVAIMAEWYALLILACIIKSIHGLNHSSSI